MSSLTLRLCLLPLLAASVHSQPLQLRLPTDNTAIFSDEPQKFYMYVNRTFEGETSRPWEGGQYGFVRTLRRVPEGVIATKFHEGLDISPVKRDSSGRPLDEVRSIAVGTVAYVQPNSGGSNYGKYVVVEHNWGDGPFFSLYAHLADIVVEPGQRLLPGTKLGKMGYTGAGINRTRAHVHLELNMLSSLRFDDWHQEVYGTENKHGIHNGLNLTGIDLAGLYLALKKDPDLSIPSFLKRTPTYYKVTCPRRGPLELADRYPWLRRGDHARPSPSWEISLSPSGIPLAVVPSHRQVSKPLITYVRTTQSSHEYYTRGRVTGTGRRASLSRTGARYIALLTGDFGAKN